MKKKHKFFIAAALVVIAFMGGMIIFGDYGVTDLYQLKDRRDRLRQVNETLAMENIRLINQLERLKSDPQYIETIARDELGLIGKDEIIIRPTHPAQQKSPIPDASVRSGSERESP
jgi:cell division protein FtsB